MERILTPDEKLRRAEEIYYQRRDTRQNSKNRTVNVSVSNKHFVLKKMIIQLVACFVVYTGFYVVKNYNFIFSKQVVDKTSEVLEYDINLQELYYKIANYIKNYPYFKNKTNELEQKNEQIEPIMEISYITDASTEVAETAIETLAASYLGDDNIEETEEEDYSNLSQMEIDAKEIKKNYSIISPLKGVITSRYGEREQTSPVVSAFHLGIDIAANTGTVIVASMDGKVVYSGVLGGYGNCVEIQNDDVLTIYGHCSKLYVKEGDSVSQGQEIAEVGSTGNSTGPHLHFEIRKDGRNVNPDLVYDF